MNTLESVWYLADENTWKSGKPLAMDDTGTLTIFPDGLTFNGAHGEIAIKQIVSITYGKQGRDFVNNWVKIEYYNGSEIDRAYFADGYMRGWSGIFGGTKRLYNLLKKIYQL